MKESAASLEDRFYRALSTGLSGRSEEADLAEVVSVADRPALERHFVDLLGNGVVRGRLGA